MKVTMIPIVVDALRTTPKARAKKKKIELLEIQESRPSRPQHC